MCGFLEKLEVFTVITNLNNGGLALSTVHLAVHASHPFFLSFLQFCDAPVSVLFCTVSATFFLIAFPQRKVPHRMPDRVSKFEPRTCQVADRSTDH